jgi:hypothetical protein
MAIMISDIYRTLEVISFLLIKYKGNDTSIVRNENPKKMRNRVFIVKYIPITFPQPMTREVVAVIIQRLPKEASVSRTGAA